MVHEGMDTTAPFLLLYVLETKYQCFFEERGDHEFLYLMREVIDELAFDRIGELYASDAELALQSEHEISLIDASDFAEDVVRVVPPERPSVGRAHKVLGFVRLQQGNSLAGKEHFEKAISIFEKWKMQAQLQALADELRMATCKEEEMEQLLQPTIQLCQQVMRRMNS